ncbi:unnamed protein product, partial [Brassica rapa subsp. narinosa]
MLRHKRILDTADLLLIFLSYRKRCIVLVIERVTLKAIAYY